MEQHESWVTAGCLLAISRDRREFWQQCGRQLQPHVQTVTGWDISRMFASEANLKITCILMNCGWLLYDMQDDAIVAVLMYRLLTHLGLDRQNVNRRWLDIYELTACNLINYGKVKEAMSLLEQVVKIREQTLAEDHPDRLTSQHELATIYWEFDRRIAALQTMKHVVEIQRRVLDDHHPDRINSEDWLENFEKETGITNLCPSVTKRPA